MRMPRMTIRRWLIAVVACALLLVAGKAVLEHFGPTNSPHYHGFYIHLGDDRK